MTYKAPQWPHAISLCPGSCRHWPRSSPRGTWVCQWNALNHEVIDSQIQKNMQNKKWRQATTTSDPKGHAAAQCRSKSQDCLRTCEKSGLKWLAATGAAAHGTGGWIGFNKQTSMSLPIMETKLLLHSMNTTESVINHGSDHHQNASQPQMQENSQSAARRWQIEINRPWIELSLTWTWNPGTWQISQGLGQLWKGQSPSWHASPTTHGPKLRPWF